MPQIYLNELNACPDYSNLTIPGLTPYAHYKAPLVTLPREGGVIPTAR